MPFPNDHYLLSFGGPLYATEEWSCGLRMSAAFADDTVGGEMTALEGLAAALASAWTTNGPASSAARLGWAKYNRIGVDGKYVRDTTNLHEWSTPPAMSLSPRYPSQVSVAVTLETGVTRGLAHRGRIFLPSPHTALEADGRWSSTAAVNTATWLAGLISTLNGVAGSGDVIVASRTRTGAQRDVTGVSCGRVLDTMRSRRTSHQEERTAPVAVTGGGTGGSF